jgi:hypothetical protein
MPEPLVVLSVLYLGLGCLTVRPCRFEAASRGWRGQLAQALATLVLTAIWPTLAWGRLRGAFPAAN